LLNEQKKLVGSCQRRRGKSLLVQGSIHVPRKIDFKRFCCDLRAAFQKNIGASIKPGALCEEESYCAKMLSAEKYSHPAWNEKF
jgi:lipoate-protein ligase A